MNKYDDDQMNPYFALALVLGVDILLWIAILAVANFVFRLVF